LNTYLDKLSDQQIRDLQLKTWKRLFRGADIERKDSFLEYFEERIKKLIGEPYREAAVEQMIITDSGDPNCYDYTTIITYKCHQVQGKLQENVTWAPGPGEFLEVRRVQVELQLPSGLNIRDDLRLERDHWDPTDTNAAQPVFHKETRTYDFPFDKLKKYYQDPNDKNMFSVPLDAFREYNGLTVTVTGEGTIARTGFIGWGMSHPTKGFVLMCRPPPGTYARYEPFGMSYEDVRRADPSEIPPDCQERLILICNTWVMPGAGIAISFQPKPTPSPKGVN